MLTKDNARLRAKRTKTPIRAGDLIMMVGTDNTYRLDSWEYINPTSANLYVIREGANQGRVRASLADFGLEIYAYGL